MAYLHPATIAAQGYVSFLQHFNIQTEVYLLFKKMSFGTTVHYSAIPIIGFEHVLAIKMMI